MGHICDIFVIQFISILIFLFFFLTLNFDKFCNFFFIFICHIVLPSHNFADYIKFCISCIYCCPMLRPSWIYCKNWWTAKICDLFYINLLSFSSYQGWFQLYFSHTYWLMKLHYDASKNALHEFKNAKISLHQKTK